MRPRDRLSSASRLGASVIAWVVLYLVGYWIFAYVTQGLIFPAPPLGGLIVLAVLFVVSRVYSGRRQYRE